MNIEEKINLNSLLEEVSEKCDVSFDDIFTAKNLKETVHNKFYFFEDHASEIISFICGGVRKVLDSGITVFIDGFVHNSPYMHNKDYRDIISKTIAYYSSINSIQSKGIIDLGSIVHKVRFSSLLNDLTNFEVYNSLVDKYSIYKTLIISNVSISEMETVLSSKGADTANNFKLFKFKSFFEEMMSRRISNKQNTIFTIQSSFDALNDHREYFGDVMGKIIFSLDGEHNNVGDDFIKREKCCRIFFPGSKTALRDIGLRVNNNYEEKFIELMAGFGIDKKNLNKFSKSVRTVCAEMSLKENLFYINIIQDVYNYIKINNSKEEIDNLMTFLMQNANILIRLRCDNNES